MKVRIIVQPPLEDGPISLSGAKRVRRWAEEEHAFWQPVGKALASPPLPTNWSEVESALARLEAWDPTTDDEVAEGRRLVERVVTTLKLTSRDPRAAFIRGLPKHESDESVLALTFQALINTQAVIQLRGNNRWHAHAAQALAYRAVYASSLPSDFVEESKQALSALLGDTRSAVDASQEELAQAIAARDEFEASNRAVLDEAKQQVAETLEAFERTQTELREKLNIQLTLRAPVEYWSSKSTRHRDQARSYRSWFTAIAAGGLVLVGIVAARWLLPLMEAEEGSWWPLVLYSALLALWAWPLRLTSKLYLAHTHLAEDAAEREVVTKTFLALSEVVQLTAEDRQLLLSALFRQSTAGLVRDEGALNLTDLLVARMASKE